jgi:hypothetical protein
MSPTIALVVGYLRFSFFAFPRFSSLSLLPSQNKQALPDRYSSFPGVALPRFPRQLLPALSCIPVGSLRAPRHSPAAIPEEARMTALQKLPAARRRLVLFLPVLVVSLILATGVYNGSIPKPPL